jgi:hypothetical protein
MSLESNTPSWSFSTLTFPALGRALRAGVAGYVTKSAPPEELREAILRVA